MNITTNIPDVSCEAARRERSNAEAVLSEWAGTVQALELALAEQAAARLAVDAFGRDLKIEDAKELLNANGSNETVRRAQHALALATSPTYTAKRSDLTDAEAALASADARVTLAKARCLLLQARIHVHVAAAD